MKNYKDLKVWEKSHQLSVAIYKTTMTFPKEEVYSLTSQIRRSCVSIAANIAEGCGRGSEADFARFLQISLGSANELEYYLLLCRDIGLLEAEDYDKLNNNAREVGKMLTSLILKVKSND